MLQSDLLPIKDLSDKLKKELFDLYYKYFENVSPEIFFEHISHKDDIILLKDSEENIIRGFSTLKKMVFPFKDKKLPIVFTGDTIIHHKFWGYQELVRRYNIYCGEFASKFPEKGVFWFLITKGYKTYRYLPVFTKKYYPSYKEETPKYKKELIDAIANHLYPKQYDPDTYLISFKDKIGNLRQGIGDITDHRLKNPDVKFFHKLNPTHIEGTELCSIAEMNEKNLRSVAKKYFMKALQGKQ